MEGTQGKYASLSIQFFSQMKGWNVHLENPGSSTAKYISYGGSLIEEINYFTHIAKLKLSKQNLHWQIFTQNRVKTFKNANFCYNLHKTIQNYFKISWLISSVFIIYSFLVDPTWKCYLPINIHNISPLLPLYGN